MKWAYKKVGTQYAEVIRIVNTEDKPEGGQRIYYMDDKNTIHTVDANEIIPDNEIYKYKSF